MTDRARQPVNTRPTGLLPPGGAPARHGPVCSIDCAAPHPTTPRRTLATPPFLRCFCVPCVCPFVRRLVFFFFRKGITVNLRQVSRAKQNVEKQQQQQQQQQREIGIGEPGWANQHQQAGASLVNGGGGGKRRKIGGSTAVAAAAAMTTATMPVANWSSESDREVYGRSSSPSRPNGDDRRPKAPQDRMDFTVFEGLIRVGRDNRSGRGGGGGNVLCGE